MKRIAMIALALTIVARGAWAGETEEATNDSLTITLNEVTIKGTMPKTRVKGDAMRTIVNGSVLERTTSATERS